MPTMKKENVTITFESERGARCPSPPSGKTGEAAAAGGASLRVGTACWRKGW